MLDFSERNGFAGTYRGIVGKGASQCENFKGLLMNFIITQKFQIMKSQNYRREAVAFIQKLVAQYL